MICVVVGCFIIEWVFNWEVIWLWFVGCVCDRFGLSVRVMWCLLVFCKLGIDLFEIFLLIIGKCGIWEWDCGWCLEVFVCVFWGVDFFLVCFLNLWYVLGFLLILYFVVL